MEAVPRCGVAALAAKKTGWDMGSAVTTLFLALSLERRLAWANRRLIAKQMMPDRPAACVCIGGKSAVIVVECPLVCRSSTVTESNK